MEDKRLDKVLDALQDIKISQAVHYEQMTQLSRRMDAVNKRVDKTEKKLEDTTEELNERISSQLSPLVKRIDLHDKYVAGIIFAVSIVAALMRFKII